jgi:predicted TPR repeat methyltransferase
MADQKTIAAYNGQVDTYLKMVGELDVDPILLRFIDRLKVSDYVLDLGCGPALASAVMRDTGLCVDPVDAAEAMVKLVFSAGAEALDASNEQKVLLAQRVKLQLRFVANGARQAENEKP